MKIIVLAGFSNSGKTTMIEKLSKSLIEKGYNIGVLKHTHSAHFTIDEPGKDTWKFAQAGAKTIVSLSDSEMAIIKKGTMSRIPLEKIVDIFRRNGTSFLFVEGLHNRFRKQNAKNVMRILCAKSQSEALELLNQNGRPICITGKLVKKLHENEINGVPLTNNVRKIVSIITK